MLEKVFISDKGEFIDGEGNAIQLRGVNIDPNVKFPSVPYLTTHSIINDSFWDDAHSVSYVNHPFVFEEIDSHINRLKQLGYNTLRYCFTWESIEHSGPAKYDFEYMDYTIRILKRIYELGDMYVYLDPHQDVWSRFTGGSGAPLWTLHCAGFQPKRFDSNKAAVLHNQYINSQSGEQEKTYPQMFWPTNYFRLAAQTMFTLFYAGKDFAPKCVVNGINIQDYLQGKFIASIMTFYKYIQDNAPELFDGNCILGLESLNEPSCGYISVSNLNKLPDDLNLRIGPMPTSFQSFKLGEGICCNIDTYEISIFGPTKKGTQMIDPQGVSAWLTTEERNELDKLYGWNRSEEWKIGCIWKLHEVWELVKDEKDQMVPKLLRPYYFNTIQNSTSFIDEEYFINSFFVNFFTNYKNKFRELDRERFIFLQPPVLKKPPFLSGNPIIDNKTIYSCHFYDGMSLMFKTWNQYYNTDTFGIMRNLYLNPVFSIVWGESNIRKCLIRQLKDIKEEGKKFLGSQIPVFFTEIGMPFDMDNKKAFHTGNYQSQISAMDALGLALEANNISFSLWCYSHHNSHKWGDLWNNEDFSIWSFDDYIKRPNTITINSISSYFGDTSYFTSSHFPLIVSNSSHNRSFTIDYGGFRALEAILRPYPTKIQGDFKSASFDLSSKTYTLEVYGHSNSCCETIIFLPYYHFQLECMTIECSDGCFNYHSETQLLKWNHKPGYQHIAIKNISRPNNSSIINHACSIM